MAKQERDLQEAILKTQLQQQSLMSMLQMLLSGGGGNAGEPNITSGPDILQNLARMVRTSQLDLQATARVPKMEPPKRTEDFAPERESNGVERPVGQAVSEQEQDASIGTDTHGTSQALPVGLATSGLEQPGPAQPGGNGRGRESWKEEPETPSAYASERERVCGESSVGQAVSERRQTAPADSAISGTVQTSPVGSAPFGPVGPGSSGREKKGDSSVGQTVNGISQTVLGGWTRVGPQAPPVGTAPSYAE